MARLHSRIYLHSVGVLIVVGLLTSAVRERGRTLLLVTHERDTVQAADKCLELRGGVITSVRKMSSYDLCSPP